MRGLGKLAIPVRYPCDEEGKKKPKLFYIEEGVRRSIVERERGFGDIEASIYQDAPPRRQRIKLGQLYSRKSEIYTDERYMRILIERDL